MLFFKTIALSLFLLAGCGGSGANEPPVQGDATDTVLPVATLESVGLSADVWGAVLRDLDEHQMQVDQIGVMVAGRLVASRHFAGHGDSTLHDMRSATKSVSGLLAGIAIDQGLIASADVAVDSFFPEFTAHPSRAAWPALTLRDLLTMRSGLDCDDWRASAGNEELMYASPNWIRFFYDVPAIGPPGNSFSYCTAGVVVLGEIVARAAGRPLAAFAQEVLFEPLGIRNARWADAPAGVTDAGGHLKLSLGSMLKMGELVRNGGLWQGQQIVSRQWIAQSLRSAVPIPGLEAHMGQLWWLEPVQDGIARSFQARGNGGQLVIVVPEFELVVAVTGHAYNETTAVQWAPFGLLQRQLIPALRKALPQPTPG
jgi:CubicO group peptidase (beta-lactamase class C family)